MNNSPVAELSRRLKDIAKDLSFLGHPRYPLKSLLKLFPEHKTFINVLEDISVPFPVDVDQKRKSMDLFLKDLTHADVSSNMKRIFTQRIIDYHLLLSMIENFDNVFFYEHSTKLYGSSKNYQSEDFYYFLEKIPEYCVTDENKEILKGEKALEYLRQRMSETFSPKSFEVKPSSSLLSDSSAGRKTLKLNPHKSYSTQQLDIFLVHEGWAHLGTSLNGAEHEEHLWLGTWAPRTTFLQEGLAILTELVSKSMTKERWNKVMLRHIATSMAERGSNITDVYSYLKHHQLEDLDALKLALRIFRGVPLDGGMAFTKELLYLHGVIELLYHLEFYKIDMSSLWVGKVSFEEHATIITNPQEFAFTQRHFPQALKTPEALERLKRLKELSFSLFKHGFL